MYLKSLTLKGFKSFCDPTIVEFKPGITAIVGPNGSGKSNIVDAVVWVLGTQGPKNVRSSKMEDVIFAGASGRPALGRAEVSLTIDNSSGKLPVSFSEVTITRTLFRTGESQYFLNSVPCKLSDILEILSDAGIGRNQHVIVSQGNLDEVLNLKPVELRLIIEEAAGILKYRKRKEATEKRLNEAEENVKELKSSIREIKNSMVPLKKQAEIASKSQVIKENLIELKTLKYQITLKALYDSESSLKIQLQKIKNEKEEIVKQLESIKSQLEQKRQRFLVLSSNNLLDSTVTFGTLKERAQGLSRLIEEKTQGLKASFEAGLNKDLISALESELSMLQIKKSELEKEEQAVNDHGLTDDDLATLSQTILELSQEKAELAKKAATLDSQTKDTEALLLQAEETYNKSFEAYHKASSRAEALSHALDAFDSEITAFGDLDINFLALRDVIEITPGFEKAVHAALSEYLRMVVLNEVDIKKAINFRKQQAFKMAFLPVFKEEKELQNKNLPTAFEPLLKFISAKANYRQLDLKLKNLLSNYVVLDKSPEELLELTKQYPDIIFVTTQGDLYCANKIVLGEQGSAIISRDLVQQAYEDAQLKQIALNNSLKELETLKQRLKDLRSQHDQISFGIKNVEKNLFKAQGDLTSRQERLFKEKDLILARLVAHKTMIQERIDLLSKRLSAHEAESKEAARKRAEFEFKLNILAKLSDQAQQVFNLTDKILNNLAFVQQENITKSQSLKNQIDQDQESLSELENTLNGLTNDQSLIEVKLAEILTKKELTLQNLKAELGKDFNNLESDKNIAGITSDEIDAQINQLNADLENLGPFNPLATRDLAELEEKLNFLNEQLNDVNMAKNELLKLINVIEQNMKVEFEKAFKEINDEFSNYISVLFPKARGVLRIVDTQESDQLGLEIDVNLTGSKLKKLSLLSGGERSLVALAFLFAVFKARPSPFYILDEVEPALDDINLNRFIDLLNEFKKTSQIIIVTHQKKTMLAADALWGVTLKEGQSSKVISQDLSKIEV
jgi:chromosome segregation protein